MGQLFAQSEFNINRAFIQAGTFYNSEIHYFPSEGGYKLYYTYKIPYSQLFFEKRGDEFASGFNVSIEISNDSTRSIVSRVFDEQNLLVKDFDLTNSKTTFLQGVITIKLDKGKYKLLTIITDKTSKRERKLPPKEIDLTKNNFALDPLVLEKHNINCDSSESYKLLNNSSTIPFNKPDAILAIPVLDSTISSLTVTIKKGDTTLVDRLRSDVPVYLINELKLCNENIVISKGNSPRKLKYFLFNKISANLPESSIKIEILHDNDSTHKNVFNSFVIWVGKPFSLNDPEEAIKYLRIIESKEKVSELLNNDNLVSALYEYWQKYDPTPATKYNELMNEFYQRVDYCETAFRSFDGKSGANSDRGKVYIKYGAPNRIERNTNNDDKIVETWYYDNPKQTFAFIDNDGKGNYFLVNGK